MTTLYTIGFTGKSAEQFFRLLREAGVRRLIDVRLHNTSQLAGFSKRGDLAFFLRELCGGEYVHELRLAPTDELFQFRKRHGGDWEEYAAAYRALLSERRVQSVLDRRLFVDGPAVLLCSEAHADECHRRIAAEYLKAAWASFDIVHL